MKQNSSFILKEIAGVPYLLPYGQMIADHRRGLKTNATGVYLWNLLEEEHSLEEVLSLSAAYYEISEEELPEFEKEITQFINQLKSHGVLVDSADSASNYPFTKLKTSREEALEAASAESCLSAPSADCEHLLSIGGLNIKLATPEDAFPPDFADFVVDNWNTEKSHLNITLHPTLPTKEPSGRVLLQNVELNIIDQQDRYLLHFPRAKSHLEIHLTKDGSEAHCYSLPPYNSDFHYDFFHAIRLLYLYQAQQHGMVAIHSASILYQDKLWLFSGHSGMGKSTHTNLWKEHFGTPVINGDLNLLSLENGTPVVHGIPWCGTSGIYDTKTYPLGGIILLEKASTDYTSELSADQKQLLVSQRLISPAWTKELWKKNMEITEAVTADILICKLHCTKEKSAAEMMKKRLDEFLK